MMGVESMLSKRRVLQVTAALVFLPQIFSSRIYCIQKKITLDELK